MKKIYLLILIIAILIISFTIVRKNSTVDNGVGSVFTAACESNPNPIFTHDITDLTKVYRVVPPGGFEEWDGKRIIKTHSYINSGYKVPIYTPYKGELNKGVYYLEGGIDQYSLFFNASCEIYYLFDHVVDPVDKIKKAFPQKPANETSVKNLSESITFEAGELVGYSIGSEFQQFDFGVYRTDKYNYLKDSNTPNSSKRDTQAVCPYDYYPDDMREKYAKLFGMARDDQELATSFCK